MCGKKSSTLFTITLTHLIPAGGFAAGSLLLGLELKDLAELLELLEGLKYPWLK